MIELSITFTGKSYSPKDNWRVLGHERHTFADMAEAKKFLQNRYGTCKRVPMYHDLKSGTKQTGWVFGYRNADWSHAPVEKWLSQDWCELFEINPVEV